MLAAGVVPWLSVPALTAPRSETDRTATIRWILQLQVENGGFLPAPLNKNNKAQPSLRATSAAVRALHYLGAEVPRADRHRQFILRCYDAHSGGFTEPGGSPNVTFTSIGIMAAVALQVPQQSYAAAWDYLRQHARSFEEIRIAAAAVEAAGIHNSRLDVRDWIAQATQVADSSLQLDARDGGARELGSAAALVLRLGGHPTKEQRVRWSRFLLDGQRTDGGWGLKGSEHSDLETTYRVLRALVHLNTPPRDVAMLNRFLAAHRSAQGGYAVTRKQPPSMSGTYYAAVILSWLERWQSPTPRP
jgi:prenyltransferase beta subunit